MSDYIQRMRAKVGHDELLQVPSVSIALRDDAGRVLLAKHVERSEWLLPGGTIEPGESPADAAVREMYEETGLLVTLSRIVGVFGGENFVVHYGNGDRTSYVMTLFEAALESGVERPEGAEILELRWFTEPEARRLALARWMPDVIDPVFSGSTFQTARWRP